MPTFTYPSPLDTGAGIAGAGLQAIEERKRYQNDLALQKAQMDFNKQQYQQEMQMRLQDHADTLAQNRYSNAMEQNYYDMALSDRKRQTSVDQAAQHAEHLNNEYKNAMHPLISQVIAGKKSPEWLEKQSAQFIALLKHKYHEVGQGVDLDTSVVDTAIDNIHKQTMDMLKYQLEIQRVQQGERRLQQGEERIGLMEERLARSADSGNPFGAAGKLKPEQAYALLSPTAMQIVDSMHTKKMNPYEAQRAISSGGQGPYARLTPQDRVLLPMVLGGADFTRYGKAPAATNAQFNTQASAWASSRANYLDPYLHSLGESGIKSYGLQGARQHIQTIIKSGQDKPGMSVVDAKKLAPAFDLNPETGDPQ